MPDRRNQRSPVVTFLILVLGCTLSGAQEPELRFDVASVKKNVDGTGFLTGGMCVGSSSTAVPTTLLGLTSPTSRGPSSISPGSCRFAKTTLKEIIAAAYGIPRRDLDRLIVGGPRWIGSDLFDIDAKADGPRTEVELRHMMQALLAERFALRVHWEARPLAGYALVQVSGGSKLNPPDVVLPSRVQTTGGGSLTATATPMARLAAILTARLGQPVIDKTGLDGS